MKFFLELVFDLIAFLEAILVVLEFLRELLFIFDIDIAFALRAMLCGSDIEINKFISESFALIAFDAPICIVFIKLLDRNSLHREFHGLKFLENLLGVGYSNFTQRTERP